MVPLVAAVVVVVGGVLGGLVGRGDLIVGLAGEREDVVDGEETRSEVDIPFAMIAEDRRSITTDLPV